MHTLTMRYLIVVDWTMTTLLKRLHCGTWLMEILFHADTSESVSCCACLHGWSSLRTLCRVCAVQCHVDDLAAVPLLLLYFLFVELCNWSFYWIIGASQLDDHKIVGWEGLDRMNEKMIMTGSSGVWRETLKELDREDARERPGVMTWKV